MKSANIRSHDVAVLTTLMMMVLVVVRMMVVEVMRMMLQMVAMVMKMMVVGIVYLSTSQAESKAIVVLFKLYSDHLTMLVAILLTGRVSQDLKEKMKTMLSIHLA